MTSVELMLVQGAIDILASARPQADSIEEACIESAEDLLRNAIAEHDAATVDHRTVQVQGHRGGAVAVKPYLAVFNVEMSYASKYPFRQGETVLVMGEVSNMPGHMVVCRSDGSVSWGWHKENFRKLKVSET